MVGAPSDCFLRIPILLRPCILFLTYADDDPLAAPMALQEFSHNPEDVDQRALCIQQSFPRHPDNPSAAKMHLSRFINTNGFIFDTITDDHQLPREVVLRPCKGGFMCLWCLVVFPTVDAAFDCVRRHIGHRPYRCEYSPAHCIYLIS
jgi:hypothetical protein